MTSPDQGKLPASAIDVLGRVALIANEARSAEVAFARTLALLASYFGCPTTQGWRLSDGGALSPHALSDAVPTPVPGLSAAPLNTTTAADLVAQVSETGPTWLRDGHPWPGTPDSIDAPGASWGQLFLCS